MLRTQKDWISQYEQIGALRLHDGTPECPHPSFLGEHSRGFFSSKPVMADASLLAESCSNLLHKLEVDEGLQLSKIDRVVGPAVGAITMAHEMARQISEGTGLRCLSAYTEKIDGVESFIFNRTSIKRTDNVLIVDDLITTSDHVRLTASAIVAAHGYVLPFVATLVNRSGYTEIGYKKVISLIDCSIMPTWTLEECPFCKEGSEAVAPDEPWDYPQT